MVLTQAQKKWKLLNGVICVYKNAGVSVNHVRNSLVVHICEDLCKLECRPPLDHVYIEGDPTKELSVSVGPKYSDSPLVTGPRYQLEDVRCSWATYLGKDTSGVFVVGINKGTRTARKFHLSRPTRSYHVKGQLGYATDTYFRDGKVVEKATFGHVKQGKLDRVLASVQAAHQKHMFEQAGVDIQSQTAYELASRGMIRPPANTVPLLYNVRCTYFSPPDFTLEVTSINENESYLKTLIHDIGMQLHTCATCTGIHCIRHGLFTLKHALLPKHWHLQHILDNMQECHHLIQETVNNTVENVSPTLVPAEEQISTDRDELQPMSS